MAALIYGEGLPRCVNVFINFVLFCCGILLFVSGYREKKRTRLGKDERASCRDGFANGASKDRAVSQEVGRKDVSQATFKKFIRVVQRIILVWDIPARKVRILAVSLTFFGTSVGGLWFCWTTNQDVAFVFCTIAVFLSLVSIVINSLFLPDIIKAKEAIYKHRIKCFMGINSDLYPFLSQWNEQIYNKLENSQRFVFIINRDKKHGGHCSACGTLNNYCINLKRINPKW